MYVGIFMQKMSGKVLIPYGAQYTNVLYIRIYNIQQQGSFCALLRS